MIHNPYLFRRSRWLWLLILLMLVPAGSRAQDDTDYELVIEMRDGTKHFIPINDNYPTLLKTAIRDAYTNEVKVVLFVKKSSAPGDRLEVEFDNIYRLFTQEASSVTVTAQSYTISQGDAIPTFEYTTTGVPLIGVPELTCEATSESAPGVYPIVVNRGTVTNENVAFVNGTLTIWEKAPSTIIIFADYLTMEYGDAVPTLTYTTEGGTLTDTPELTCEATSSSPVGNYPISLNYSSINNDNVQFIPASLTITRAPLTITSKDCSIVQYESMPESYELEYSGFKNGETEAVLLSQPQCYALDETVYAQITSSYNAGKYRIDIVGAQADNYDITYNYGYLTIVEAPPVTIRAKSYTIDYGDDTPEPEYTVEGGKLYGEPSIWIAVGTNPARAGVYEITLNRNTIINEKLTLINGELVVLKVPLTVTARSYTITKGDAFPTFEYDYDGFKRSDSKFNAVWPWPEITTTATDDSPAGEYPIIVSGGESANYNLIYVNGVLTINEPSDIDSLDVEAGPVDVYTTAGTLVARGLTSYESLPMGIYIVKTANSKTFKLTRK